MLITKRSDTYDRQLYRKKNGGGRSSGSSKGGSRGSTSGSSLSSGGGKIKSGKSTTKSSASSRGGTSSSGGGEIHSGKSATKSSTSIVKTGGTSRHAVADGVGGGSSTAGGATRSQSYGDYGSGGYPCPFNCSSSNHGRGIMMTAAFPSSSQNTTFRVVADDTTLSTLLVNIVANCSSDISFPSTITPTTFNDSLVSPKPEQTVQYYRAGTVALTLDGYNNAGALEIDGTPDTPLPTNIDANLLNCLNYTIGQGVPLIGSASLQWTSPSIGLISFIWVLWCLSSVF